MTTLTHPPARRWHPLLWAAAAALLTVPAIAMRFTEEVQWTASDFVVMGGMLAAACGAFELLLRAGNDVAYRLGAAVAVLGVFFLVWVNLAVGIIGSEHNHANRMFAAVIATVVGGACVSRLQAAGLARTMLAASGWQVLIAAIAVIGRLGSTESGMWPKDILGCTVILCTLWLVAAALFHRADRR